MVLIELSNSGVTETPAIASGVDLNIVPVPLVYFDRNLISGIALPLKNNIYRYLSNSTSYRGMNDGLEEFLKFVEDGICVGEGTISLMNLNDFARDFSKLKRIKRMYLKIETDVLPPEGFARFIRSKNPLPQITNPYDCDLQTGIQKIIQDFTYFKKEEFVLSGDTQLALRQWHPLLRWDVTTVVEANLRLKLYSQNQAKSKIEHSEIYDYVVRFEATD